MGCVVVGHDPRAPRVSGRARAGRGDFLAQIAGAGATACL
ncbi:hypothetical protein BTZ20_1000 [Rhodococcus sp. MTM3W5.2]|nr:hypothetical protein BTZ20_1000 [Rhodococcus sp. MTM3W5.2]